MKSERRQSGFSLTEVLMAVGTLAVGMVFIAGVFPAGIHFTTIATERTIAAVIADEAFAKIRIYAEGNLGNITDNIQVGLLLPNAMKDFNDNSVFPATGSINTDEFTYPSTDTAAEKQYYWSALCRRVGPASSRLVQVTVFISRKVSPNLKYPDPKNPTNGSTTVHRPMPVEVEVSSVTNRDNELDINLSQKKTFINDGYIIVDDATGRIYRVLERYRDDDDRILLDRDWQGANPPNKVWVIPPPVTGNPPVGRGRCPCIAVHQKIIRF